MVTAQNPSWLPHPGVVVISEVKLRISVCGQHWGEAKPSGGLLHQPSLPSLTGQACPELPTFSMWGAQPTQKAVHTGTQGWSPS